MFGVDWSDPQVFWLNVTNLSLGVVTLICVLVLAFGVAVEIRQRMRRKAQDAAIDGEVRSLVGSYPPLDDGTHIFDLPGLGLTMADGGEPVKQKSKPRPRQGKGGK